MKARAIKAQKIIKAPHCPRPTVKEMMLCEGGLIRLPLLGLVGEERFVNKRGGERERLAWCAFVDTAKEGVMHLCEHLKEIDDSIGCIWV